MTNVNAEADSPPEPGTGTVSLVRIDGHDGVEPSWWGTWWDESHSVDSPDGLTFAEALERARAQPARHRLVYDEVKGDYVDIDSLTVEPEPVVRPKRPALDLRAVLEADLLEHGGRSGVHNFASINGVVTDLGWTESEGLT